MALNPCVPAALHDRAAAEINPERRGCRPLASMAPATVPEPLASRSRLPEVFQAPQLREARVVGRREGADDVIGLGVEHVGAARKEGDEGRGVERSGPQAQDACATDGIERPGVRLGAERRGIRRLPRVAEPHQGLSGHCLTAVDHLDGAAVTGALRQGRRDKENHAHHGGEHDRAE
jgi:hypothetical protein